MKERPIEPSDMLLADYAGLIAVLAGLGLAFRSAPTHDVGLMWTAVAVTTVGAVLKVGSTRYKGRIDRERRGEGKG